MLYSIFLILITSFTLSACSPQAQGTVDVSINLYGLERNKLLLDDTFPSSDNKIKSADITFFSAFNQSKPDIVNGYNYVYALNSGQHWYNAPLLASNLPIVGVSKNQEVYDFAIDKTHAKVYVKKISGQKVAFLSLIDLERTYNAKPSRSDLKKLGSTIDRGAIEGWNKVVLISQYSPSTTKSIIKQLKGVDLAITLGSERKITRISKTCLAEFPYDQEAQLPIKTSFSANGYTTQCHW